MKAPKAEIPFWLYITAEDSMIGVVLAQVTDGKEHIIMLIIILCLLQIKTLLAI
jgi:hypothetical protein